MKLTCLTFQKKNLDVKIINGGSRDLKYRIQKNIKIQKSILFFCFGTKRHNLKVFTR